MLMCMCCEDIVGVLWLCFSMLCGVLLVSLRCAVLMCMCYVYIVGVLWVCVVSMLCGVLLVCS